MGLRRQMLERWGLVEIRRLERLRKEILLLLCSRPHRARSVRVSRSDRAWLLSERRLPGGAIA